MKYSFKKKKNLANNNARMKDYYSNESLLTVVQKYIYIYI